MKKSSSLDVNTSPTYCRGVLFESIVADELIEAGFVIVAKNYRLGHKEIDLVALEGDTLCIIEVKSRARAGLLRQPDILIDRNKRQDMIALGNYFAKSHRSLGFRDLRFDFALVLIPSPGEEPRIKYYRNAFLPSLRGTF